MPSLEDIKFRVKPPAVDRVEDLCEDKGAKDECSDDASITPRTPQARTHTPEAEE